MHTWMNFRLFQDHRLFWTTHSTTEETVSFQETVDTQRTVATRLHCHTMPEFTHMTTT